MVAVVKEGAMMWLGVRGLHGGEETHVPDREVVPAVHRIALRPAAAESAAAVVVAGVNLRMAASVGA